ncbi:MAG: flagellar basal body P-ring formation chaperone FlgA [Candidatus Margulisiibacteriota bacterium]|jgi:flagella basal body P-ring formation protein FlgA
MKKIIGVLLLCCSLSGVVLAATPAERIVETIKGMVLAKYPNVVREELRVEIKIDEKGKAALLTADDASTYRVMEVFPDFKPIGNVIFPIEVKKTGAVGKIFVRAKVEVLKKIVVAAAGLGRNKPLQAGDFTYETRDVALLPQKYYTDFQPLLGKEAKIPIPANSTIFEWMIGEPPVIRAGSEVGLVVAAPDISVRVAGLALENGYLNEQIKVRKKESGKILFGKVLSNNEVEVELK